MIRVQFYSDCNFANFLSDLVSVAGEVPGVAHEESRHLLLTQREYEKASPDIAELIRDYGGQIVHQKSFD